jgi:hypothetical protein
VSGSGDDGSDWTELVRAGEVAPPTPAVLDRATAAVREAAVREAAVREAAVREAAVREAAVREAAVLGAAHGAGRRPGRRRWVAAVAAVAVVAAAVALGGRPDAGPVPTPARTPMAVPAPPPVPTSPAAGGAASCAEEYNLGRRSFAFDGTVTAMVAVDRGVRPASRVTFVVHHWYRGARGPMATVILTPSGALTEDGQTPPLAYAVGTRLLVSGEFWGPPPVLLAWAACGPYTRPYAPAAAAEWASAFHPGR